MTYRTQCFGVTAIQTEILHSVFVINTFQGFKIQDKTCPRFYEIRKDKLKWSDSVSCLSNLVYICFYFLPQAVSIRILFQVYNVYCRCSKVVESVKQTRVYNIWLTHLKDAPTLKALKSYFF